MKELYKRQIVLAYQFAILFITQCNTDTAVVQKFELHQIEDEWKRCCLSENALCFENSCYTFELRPASWATIRDRCRSRFPEWSYAIDLLHMSDPQEANILRNLTEKIKPSSRDLSELLRKGFWTSGSCCRSIDSRGSITEYHWAADGGNFPKWMTEHATCFLERNPLHGEECQFLVISFNSRDDKYEFSFHDQQEKHIAVCQFVNVGKIHETTNPPKESTTAVTSYSTIRSRSINTEITTLSSLKITDERSSEEDDDITSVIVTTITDFIPTSLYTTDDRSETTSRQEVNTDVEFSIGCKKRESSGILWPDTPPGATVKQPCPEGMIGTAEWKCDAETLKFTPPRPRIQDCRHAWIVNLEKEVEDSNKDAVELSQRLANRTTRTTLSHGDLSALVNLTEKLIKLFAKQRKGLTSVFHREHDPAYRFAKSMVTSYSHVLRSDVVRAWTDLDQVDRLREASRILQQVSETGQQLSCGLISKDNDLQYTLVEENINLQTFQVNPAERNGRPYVFPKKVATKTNSTFILPGSITFDRWPTSPCRRNNQQRAVGILYDNLGQFLRNEDTEDVTGALVVSPIISFSLSNSSEIIPLPNGIYATIELERYAKPADVRYYKKPRCVFWNFNLGNFGDWDSFGCRTVGSNISHTRCSCNHLTNFAILMDVNNVIPVDDDILEPMTLICCAVSTVALVATCLVLLGMRALRCRRSTITCNLSFCLLVVNVLILFGLSQTQIKVLCAAVAGFMHFFVLAAFCWMLLEGFHLYQMVVLVFYQSFHISIGYYYCFGYGVPLLIVGISASLDSEHYGRSDVCWLSNENGLMWSLVGPVALIICINFMIFVRTLQSASSVKIKKEQPTVSKAKTWLKGSMSIMCLLGLTWAVGFLYMIKGLYFTSYIFTVLNGFQGVFIFIFHVLLNEKVTNIFVKAFQRKTTKSEKHFRNLNLPPSGHLRQNKQSLTTSLTSITKTTEEIRVMHNSSQFGPQKRPHIYDLSTRRGTVERSPAE